MLGDGKGPVMKKVIGFTVLALLLFSFVAFVGCGTRKQAQTDTTKQTRPAVKKITVGDIQVGYRVYGKGYPLVMVMGYGGTQDIWDPTVIDMLSRKYKVITFDNRGMGATTAGTRPFTIQQFADDTAGFMDALGITKANVLGWSMGTYISQDLVLTYPQKVNKLVLYAADPGGPQAIPPTPENLAKLTDTSGTAQQRGERLLALLFPSNWFEQKKNADYMTELVSTSTLPTPPESIQKQSQAMGGQWGQVGVYDRLPTIKSPTMLLTGTDDILTPAQNSLLMVQQIPNAWLTQFQGGGHGVQFQCPEAFSNTVLNFFAAPDKV